MGLGLRGVILSIALSSASSHLEIADEPLWPGPKPIMAPASFASIRHNMKD